MKRLVPLLIAFALAIGVGTIAIGVNGRYLSRDSRPLGIIGPVDSCSSYQAPLAVLARIRPGHRSTELSQSGFSVTASSEPDLVVVRQQGGLPRAAAVAANPAVQTAGLLMAQTTDRGLRSCNYRLIDNSRAVGLLRTVEPQMEASGLISSAQFYNTSTIYLITDDPTNAAHLFVAAVLATPASASSHGALTPVVATVDRSSGAVVHVGLGHWYD